MEISQCQAAQEYGDYFQEKSEHNEVKGDLI